LLFIRRIAIFHLVCLAWIFFRIPTLQGAWEQIASLARWEWQPVYLTAMLSFSFFASLLLIPDLQLEASNGEHVFASWPLPWRVATGLALCILITLGGANQQNAFIYFCF
jgi:alginate O-acetyltransferase complex protein AlgI